MMKRALINRALAAAALALLLLAPATARAAADPAAAAAPGEAAATCTACTPGEGDAAPAALLPPHPPKLENCTEYYQYFTARRFEHILTMLLQYETIFGGPYLDACLKQESPLSASRREAIDANVALARAEAADIVPVMEFLIRRNVTAFVPAHCKTNMPAQDEVVAGMNAWIAQAREAYAANTAALLDSPQGRRLECRHLEVPQRARVYGLDLRRDPLLAIAAGYTVIRTQTGPHVRNPIITYKGARDHLHAAPAAGESVP